MIPETELLQHALAGCEARRNEIARSIDALRLRLRGTRGLAQPVTSRAKRKLSLEGRARIVAAAKKRWAKLRRARPAKKQ